MIVAEAMSRPVFSVSTETRVDDALRLLDAQSITMLPVLADGVLVGVVSEADLLAQALPPEQPDRRHDPDRYDAEPPAPVRVSSVMRHFPVTVHPGTDLSEAGRLLSEVEVKSVPVVDEHGIVVGILSRRDVIHVLAREHTNE